jgi:hypothetical protein
MAETEHREQHNHGSGTFVGGNVTGGIWQIFVRPSGKKQTNKPSPHGEDPEQDDDEKSDYEDPVGYLVGSAVLVATAGIATAHEIMGQPWAAGSPAPGLAERIGGGTFFSYLCLAAVASFFSRIAQIFELWSRQCARTATQNRGRFVARPPARTARAMAVASAAASIAAEIFASLYGWLSFGVKVSRRAHIARLNAEQHANTARDAAKKKPVR